MRQARIASGWSILDLSAASGLSPGYTSIIETGRAEFSLKSISALSKALFRKISWLAESLNEHGFRGHQPHVPLDIDYSA